MSQLFRRAFLSPTLLSLAVVPFVLAFFIHTAPVARAAEGPNLVPNSSLEIQDGGTNPTSWAKGRWGVNTAIFRYPSEGTVGSRAVEVELTQRTSGDAKWHFAEVPVTGGATYRFTDQYRGTVGTYVTAQYRHANGTLTWVDLGTPAPAADWQAFDKTFVAPASAVQVTVFHLINAVGTLRVDDFSLRQQVAPSTSFTEGFVSLNFDDGWKSSYQSAVPILDAAGLRSTQYIITGRFSFPAYLNQAETLDLYQRGHEIGAHTRTHRDLTTLSEAELTAEVSGSRQDLLDLGIAPVATFAYPFGAYNASTTPIIQQAGFVGARTSDGGFNARTGNVWLLKRKSVDASTSLAQIEAWIEQARAQKLWLILVFHRVDTSGASTAITPQLFQEIVTEIQEGGLPVRTMAEGIQLMAS